MATPRDLELVLAHRSFVRALARELVFDAELARDVEQETWLAALSNVPRDAGAVRGWLAGIVRRVAWKAWRTRQRRGDLEDALLREPRAVSTPDELVERENLRREIVEAVVALDEPWREALIARYFEELSPEEAAQKLGVPLETLRTRLKRGRELLRERLQRRGGGPHWALALVGAWRLEPPSYAALVRTLWKKGVFVSSTQKAVAALAVLLLLAGGIWIAEHEGELSEPRGPDTGPAMTVGIDAPRAQSSAALESARVPAEIPATTDLSATAHEPSSFGSLRVHVVWAEDRTPAAGIWMRLVQDGAEDPYRTWIETQTDANGDAFVERVIPGEVVVKLDRGEQAQVHVDAGVESTQLIGIQTGFDVHGTVVDFDDRPFAGAAIYVQIFGGSYEGFVVGRSAADGSFAIRALAPETGISISALAPDRAPTKQHVFMEERGAKVALKLAFEAPGGSFAGRVSSPDGAPVAGACVLIGKDYDPTQVALADGSPGRPPASHLARTNEGGEFLIEGVSAGPQPVQVQAIGFAPWRGDVDIVAGGSRAKDIVLELGASLRGVVRDAAKVPLAGVDVLAHGDSVLAAKFCRTRADGSYSIRDLPLGEFVVTVDDEGHGYAETKLFGIAGGELRWDPDLSTGEKLRVRVVAPGKRLASGWCVTAEQQPRVTDGYAYSLGLCEDGVVEFVNVPDVELRLSLRAPKEQFPRAIREGVRARDSEVLLPLDPALEPTVFLRGRVVDPDGKPFGGARVWPVQPRLFYPPTAVTDETGAFAFGPLPAGDWRIEGVVAGFAPLRSSSARVDSGATWDFGELRLQRGGSLAARIELEGRSVDAQVTAALRDAAGESIELIVEGGVARSGMLLIPGHYTLSASCGGFAPAELALDVRAEEETRVTLELRRL